jgi:transcriptional regulator with XRE-family HTH domain
MCFFSAITSLSKLICCERNDYVGEKQRKFPFFVKNFMSTLSENIKRLRKKKQITQTQLAELLELNRPIIGSYEEGRAEPKTEVLKKMASCFNVSVDELLSTKLTSEENSEQEFSTGKNLRILSVVVNEHSGEERIPLIPIKAAAGYLQGYGDPEFIEQLNTFELPFQEMKPGKTYRMFQIKGDSMLPVPDGAYIISSYVQDWNGVKSGQCYVAVTENNGIVYKRVVNKLNESQSLVMTSDNIFYEHYEVPVQEIKELWKAHGFVSFDLP